MPQINAGGGVRLGGVRSLNGVPAAPIAGSTDSASVAAETTSPGSGHGLTPGHLAMYWEIAGTGLLFLMYFAAPGRNP